jgi:hypothetical protein
VKKPNRASRISAEAPVCGAFYCFFQYLFYIKTSNFCIFRAKNTGKKHFNVAIQVFPGLSGDRTENIPGPDSTGPGSGSNVTRLWLFSF